MLYYLVFMVMGYCLGSILFTSIIGKQKCGKLLSYICNITKGFLPVFLCLHLEKTIFGNILWYPEEKLLGGRSGIAIFIGLAFVLAAPVLGELFPFINWKKDGKTVKENATAVTCGILLGYVPDITLTGIFIFFIILYLFVVQVSPDFYRICLTYLSTMGVIFVWGNRVEQKIGFLFITLLVCFRTFIDAGHLEHCRINLLWVKP